MESAENQAQSASINEVAVGSSTLSKAETIALLNDSIDQLEETISKISQNSTTIPTTNFVNDLVSSTQALKDSVVPQLEIQGDRTNVAPTAEEATSSPKTTVGKKPQTSKTVVREKKKNTGLIVIAVTAIAVAIVTVFWLWRPELVTNLLPQKQPIPAEVAISDTNLEEPEVVSAIDPDDSGEIPDRLSASNNNSDFPAVIEPAVEPIDDIVETVIPDELAAPGRTKELKMTAIEPQLNFTPEQNLIAAVETKVDELIQTYPNEYVAKVEMDLPHNSLLVRVTDNWYDLEESRQNSLGGEILQRSREFSFSKLQLLDSKGNLVARSPIVGNNIILLETSRTTAS